MIDEKMLAAGTASTSTAQTTNPMSLTHHMEQIAPRVIPFRSRRYSSRRSGIRESSTNLCGRKMAASLWCLVKEIRRPFPPLCSWTFSDCEGTELDMATTQTTSLAGREMCCRKLWMPDVMSMMPVPTHMYSQHPDVLNLRLRIGRLRIHVNRARLQRKISMLVS